VIGDAPIKIRQQIKGHLSNGGFTMEKIPKINSNTANNFSSDVG
jgi:hypothetical protein